MSTALDLIRRCYCAGVDVGLNDRGGVRLTRNAPPTDLTAELMEHRDDVVALLQEHRYGEPNDVLTGAPRRYVSPPDCIAVNACACLGPCSRFLTLRPCENRKGQTHVRDTID